MALPNAQNTEHPIGGGGNPFYVGGANGQVGFFQDPYGAIFTGTISGTTLTVLSLTQGTIVQGQIITTGAAANTIINSMGTATSQNGAGALGTWNISVSQTVSTVTQFTSGQGAVSQPTGNAQAAVTRGLAAGVVATYVTAQSPSAVAANTSGEKAMTVQTGTGATMLLATTDLCYVNKPTSQAGLGVGNIRVSASNTAQVTMTNYTAASITPTASENYFITALRGLPVATAVLSPASVAANSTFEQQFTVTGLPVGDLVQVVKPTSQAGLDIVGCRIVSNNLLGITFANVTATAIVPTASESYTVFGIPGLDAVNNDVLYGMNVGTVGAIGAGVVATGGSTTLTGVLATDITTGVYKPTNGAAATNAASVAGAVLSANAATIYFNGIGTGATPTAAEVYGIRTARLNPAAPLLLYTPALTPASVAANTTAEQTFTVTGLIANSPVWVNKPSFQSGLGIAGVRVSAANTLAINFVNTSSAAIVPTAETYVVGNFQTPAPGAGNCVYQSTVPVVDQNSDLNNAIRSALVSMNLILGA